MRSARALPFLTLAVAGGCLLAAEALAAGSGAPRLAYVDPGSGSFVLQALVAALAGVVVVVNTYWQKIRTFFGRSSGGDSERDVPSKDE